MTLNNCCQSLPCWFIIEAVGDVRKAARRKRSHMRKLVSMGDCIVDLLPSAPGAVDYQAKMGGAPVNVCAAVAKLGGKACFFGKLAEDAFGRFLLGEMASLGIDTSLVVTDGACKTGLAFVDLKQNGDRDFFFYRDTPADAALSPEEVDGDIFRAGDVMHFCSISLPESPTRHAIKKAAVCARERGAYVSFDVNVRLHLWKSEKALKEAVREFLPLADIVKVTDDELAFITGLSDEKEGVKCLFDASASAKLVFVTRGEKGSAVYDRAMNAISREAYPTRVEDTTGAGDCFIGSVIYKLLRGEAELTAEGMKDAMDLAVRACACVVSKKGGAPSMPTLKEAEGL